MKPDILSLSLDTSQKVSVILAIYLEPISALNNGFFTQLSTFRHMFMTNFIAAKTMFEKK
uniref:Uncharacterized protein n=1 Tax=Onchocerca volvulus TaxID=6282 RepID=A0A8R1TJH4_ONCVO